MKLCSDLDSFSTYIPEYETLERFMEFASVSGADIRKLVMSCKTTTCDLDPFPTNMVKIKVDILVPLLTKIVNLSLSQGKFPITLKTAIIKPPNQEGWIRHRSEEL